jgi:hypothetical protein
MMLAESALVIREALMAIGPCFILLVLGASACVAVAAVVMVASRRRADTNLPRCGNCGYNLTGAPSNRCPECGDLFIEAGVVVKQPRPVASRRVMWGLMLVLAGFAVLAVLGTIAMNQHASATRTQTIAAERAAIQARMQALAGFQ